MTLILFTVDIQFVISSKEKSRRETPQRLDFRYGIIYEDFSFVEMTKLCRDLRA
ncbi:hypothetical protein HNP37_001586 [Flavobacterium nitrogenifigens]|uniref:Uncharacterized protein n=2 Tax=Flavobacterium TaxID=237 RepID=A0A7W7IX30_9FLAO|nr:MULTISPECIES: hypothetical protein [Flavobacterium]MBB4801525.1 hypothetical protein [Flavobacterium nitrogenifigens]MBB6386482.1 hypothetical protein [Flavobacterium notoginsengisoli]